MDEEFWAFADGSFEVLCGSFDEDSDGERCCGGSAGMDAVAIHEDSVASGRRRLPWPIHILNRRILEGCSRTIPVDVEQSA